MMDKKYKCGLYVGRFQPLHMGHYSIINDMLDECETVVVAVGSAQECKTEKNPFSYGLRASLIYKSFSGYYDQLQVIPVVDREHPSNDPSWGDYLLDKVKTFTGLVPDVIFQGQEHERTKWYANYNIPVISYSRSILPITATRVRKALRNNDVELFRTFVPMTVSFKYDHLRKELLKCYNLPET